MLTIKPHRNIFLRQKPLHVAHGVSAKMKNAGGQNCVGMAFHIRLKFFGRSKGQAAFAVEKFFQPPVAGTGFAPDDSGATRSPISRRNRRPFSQSSQLIEPSIGMQGTFDFEFISDFFHQLHAARWNSLSARSASHSLIML